MNGIVEWGALGQVVVAGLVVGAGIPALFALGLRLLAGTTAAPRRATAAADRTSPERGGPVVIPRPPVWRLVAAVLCFGTVVGAVATGIVFLAAGGHS